MIAPLHYSPPLAPTWRRVLGYPLLRLVMAFGLVVSVIVGVSFASASLDEGWWPQLARTLALVGATLGAYMLYVHAVEQRRPAELASTGAVAEAGRGFATGGALQLGAFLGIAAITHVEVQWAGDHAAVASGLVAGVAAGWTEELIARGIIFRIVEEWGGSAIALLVSSAFFGFAHAGNPNASLWSSLAIALEAGLLLGATYMLTRRLWLAIGLHAGWNFVQGSILGVSVSGVEASGWLRTRFDGPTWLSGGAFGAEASVVTVGVCLVVAAWLLHRCIKRGQWVSFKHALASRRS